MQPWLKIVATSAVFALVACEGLETSLQDLKFFVHRRALLFRSLLAVLVLVPIGSYIVILATRPARPVSIALALFAACPAAPLMLVRTSGLRGAREYSRSLHVILSILSIISVPLTLFIFAKALAFSAGIGPLAIARIVASLVLVPLFLGLCVALLFPSFSLRVSRMLQPLSKLMILAALVVLFSKTYTSLAQMSLQSYLAIFFAVLFSLLIGAAVAWRAPSAQRTVLALECAGRHPGLVLLIVSINRPQADAMPILIPYLCVFVVVSTLFVFWSRSIPQPSPART